MSGSFVFKDETLHDLLKTRYFQVPRYQRPYSWDEQQLADFWNDMGASIDVSGGYFLGSIVLSKQDVGVSAVDSFFIIDGQQRIATTTILLAALRDLYFSNGKPESGIAIDGLLTEHDIDTDQKRRRLRLSTSDDQFYRRYIIENNADEMVISESHRRMKFAKQYFIDLLSKFVERDPVEWATQFRKIFAYLKNDAKVIVVTTASDADAFTIFETLNDRGADLTIADLMKNFLFSSSKTEIDTAQTYWTEAQNQLAEVQSEDEFVNFIRQLWSSRKGVVRERDLYRSIKANVTDINSSLDFCKFLRDGSVLYKAIVAPKGPYWDQYDAQVRRDIKALDELKVQQVRVLLLACLSVLGKDKVSRIIHNLVSWSVRIIVAGNQGGGQVERYFTDAAVKVRNGEVADAEQLLTSLANVIPTDSNFKNGFAIMSVKRGPLARFYLRSIERYVAGDSAFEQLVNDEATELNLEHILPQSADPAMWGAAFPGASANDYKYRLGNMTLLRKADNIQVGNGGWATKQAAFGKSSLRINEELAQVHSWDPESVDLRQSSFAERALQAWPLIS